VRRINLEKHITRIESTVTIVNNDGDKPVSEISLLPDPNLQSRLSSFLVYVDSESVFVNPATWQAKLPAPIDPDQSLELSIEEIYTHATKPLPTKIKQSQKQLMTYQGSLHHFSPYETKRETVKVTFPSSSVESVSPTADRKGRHLEYPEFKDLSPKQLDKVFYHYEAMIPYVTTHYLLREIEVSHWGMVSVKDHAEVRHVGAELQGSFSRVQYAHDGGDDAVSTHYVPALTAKLPKFAQDVSYTDAIGNISTSHMRMESDKVTVELRPRTPLFGGWKSDYTLGWKLPTEKALKYSKSNPSRFHLSLKAIDELYPDQVVDQVELQVILPETAKDVNVKIPAGFERAHDRVKFTYLDISGRPVIILRAENLAGKSLDQMLEVEYTYARNAIFREPGMTILFFFFVFLVVIFFVRLDFNISDDGSNDVKARINAAFQRAQEANVIRTQSHAKYGLAIQRYRETKDLAIISDPQKNYREALTSFTNTLQDIISEYKKVVGDKLAVVKDLTSQSLQSVSKGEAGYSKVKDLDAKINQALE